jgi:hypothetical protein
MRSDRVARRLLGLYPRAWRARYGDEFLALVEDQGLSWRGVVDVVAAASVERARAIRVALRALDDPPSAPLEPVTSFREWFVPKAALLAFAGVAMLALGAIGVPYPQRMPLAQFVFQVFLLDLQLDWRARLADRIARSLYQLTVAMLVAGSGWLVAFLFTAMGALPPSEPLLLLVAVLAVGCAGVRFLSRAFRPIYRSFRRPGESTPLPPIRPVEVQAWSFIMFAVIVTMAMIDPQGQAYWTITFTAWIFVRLRAFRRAHVVKP